MNINDENLIFSFVLFNDEISIENTVNSIFNQNFDLDGIEIIFIDSKHNRNSRLALEYQNKFFNNFFIIKTDVESKAHFFNMGLEKARGKYINFINPGDTLSKNTLSEVNSYFNSNIDLGLINIPISINKDYFIIDYEFDKNQEIDLEKCPEFSIFGLNSFFIKTDNINIRFNENLVSSCDSYFLNELLLHNKLGFASKANLYKWVSNPFLSVYPYDYYKQITLHNWGSDIFFINSFKRFENVFDKFEFYFKKLEDELLSDFNCIPSFVQFNFAKELADIVETEEINEITTNPDEINKFYDLLSYHLSFIDLSSIRQNRFIDVNTQNFLIYLKNNDFHVVLDDSNHVLFYAGDVLLDNLNNKDILMDIVEINNGNLNFSGNIISHCPPEFLSVHAVVESENEKKIYDGVYNDYSTSDRKTRRYLSCPWGYNYNFDVKIPIENESRINFILKYKHDDIEAELSPEVTLNIHAGLSQFTNYFIKDSHIVSFSDNSFSLIHYSYKDVLKLEFKSISKALKDCGFYTILFKLIFLILIPFMINKRIWLFCDRMMLADDNCEHLFKYSIKQDDNIKKYYVINKKSVDYKRLKAISNNIIAYGSLKHKLLFLFSEKLVNSHFFRTPTNPFLGGDLSLFKMMMVDSMIKNNYLYSGAFYHDFCFIQHGIILHDLSSYFKKYDFNYSVIVTTVEKERYSIISGNYNYDEDRIQLLGLTRYDNLINEENKQILLSPTWRVLVDDYDLFANSDYLKSVNSFLNNQKLIDTTKKYGYNLVFKIHPELHRFKRFFILPEEFKITTESYSKLLRESSIMITDYSSVAFDFAYLKKPIIYYQNKENETFHNPESYFDYETMAFGDIVTNEDDLVDKIIYFMENGTVMDDAEYKKRCEDFFYYNDRNNCKRVYEWLLNH